MKEDCVSCFKNLGVESRIKIYMFLGQNDVTDGAMKGISQPKPKNVSEITKYIGLKQPTVSYHLTEMLKSGLLVKKTIGKEVFYSISSKCPHDESACCIATTRGDSSTFAPKDKATRLSLLAK